MVKKLNVITLAIGYWLTIPKKIRYRFFYWYWDGEKIIDSDQLRPLYMNHVLSTAPHFFCVLDFKTLISIMQRFNGPVLNLFVRESATISSPLGLLETNTNVFVEMFPTMKGSWLAYKSYELENLSKNLKQDIFLERMS